MNAPNWTKWEGKQIETSTRRYAAMEQLETVIAYSILNSSDPAY